MSAEPFKWASAWTSHDFVVARGAVHEAILSLHVAMRRDQATTIPAELRDICTRLEALAQVYDDIINEMNVDAIAGYVEPAEDFMQRQKFKSSP